MWIWTWIWSLKNANPLKSSRNHVMSILKSDLDLQDFACRMSCSVGVQMHCSAMVRVVNIVENELLQNK
jgi:hypothetical protein